MLKILYVSLKSQCNTSHWKGCFNVPSNMTANKKIHAAYKHKNNSTKNMILVINSLLSVYGFHKRQHIKCNLCKTEKLTVKYKQNITSFYASIIHFR